jgi:hypothetical protein
MTNLIPIFGRFDVRHNPYVTYLEWLSSQDDSHFSREHVSTFLVPGNAYERWCALSLGDSLAPTTRESFKALARESINFYIGRQKAWRDAPWWA